MKKTLLIIEDDPNISKLIELYATEADFRVVKADNGKDGLNYALKIQPSLIILDQMLPELSGTEVLQQLRHQSDCPVIFVTAKGEEIDRILGLELGADDYVTKPFSPKELMARIKAVLRRRQIQSDSKPEPIHYKDLALNPKKHLVQQGSKQVELSVYEFKLLQILIQNPGRVFTREELIDRLYDSEGHYVFDRTIDAHVKNLRKKLGDKARKPNYIASVFGVGYKALD